MSEVKLNKEDKGILSEFRELKKQEDDIKAKLSELQPYVVEIMEEFEMKDYQLGDLKVTYIPETTSKRFDSTGFKKANPEVAEQYQKESIKAAHIRAKIKE